tara:strand:- start:102 stop:965 length:864 start_codon:yes stop_codon:yes gene_type:complete
MIEDRKPMWITVDFEDFSHDLKRSLQIEASPSIRKKSLDEAYFKINNHLKNFHNSSKITFFCTGILSKLYPDIVKRISDDGHEIACHYNFHDDVYSSQVNVFEENINEAIYHLEKASGQKIVGFRAPRLSIKASDHNHLDILSKYFLYDSSILCSSKEELVNIVNKNNITNLEIIPIPKQYISTIFKNYRLGGSYFKLFSSRLTLKVMDKSYESNLNPILYLHPYDFNGNDSFMVGFSELDGLPILRKIYWYFRQYQWNKIGNKSSLKKLELISTYYCNQGPLKELI